MKPIIHSYWLEKIEYDCSQQFEIWIDELKPEDCNPEHINILLIAEPPWINPISKKKLIHNNVYQKYQYIFTFDNQILDLPNAVFFPFAGSWISHEEVEQEISSSKTFKTSFICTNKWKWNGFGYHIRHKLWNQQHKINTPHVFYNSSKFPLKKDFGNPFIKDKKYLAFANTMFHITIENSSIENYFTEKIIDCLATKTIPIYWGCKNIGDFFNLDGIILVKNARDIIQKVNQLTPEDYYSRIAAIEENFEKVKAYRCYERHLANKLQELERETSFLKT